MKSLLAILAFGVAAVMSQAVAAEAVADMKPPIKWAPAKKTMEKNGRFHYLHVKKQKMDCADCHADESKDKLFLRSNEAPPATLVAHVDRAECTECHQGDKKPTWYGAKPR
ncbi:MAG: hypothetical protein ABI409_03305 [Ramlibacter sp.]